MSVVSGSNLARAFMVSADDVINTRRVISEPLRIEMEQGASERQTLFHARDGFLIGFCLEARKIGVSQKHALAILQNKGAEIAKKATEWTVVTSLGGAETAISIDDLATVLDSYVGDGASAFNVIHVPSIRARVDRAVRLTANDLGANFPETRGGWSGDRTPEESRAHEARVKKVRAASKKNARVS